MFKKYAQQLGMVIYERQQTVYHLTVARALAGGVDPLTPTGPR